MPKDCIKCSAPLDADGVCPRCGFNNANYKRKAFFDSLKKLHRNRHYRIVFFALLMFGFTLLVLFIPYLIGKKQVSESYEISFVEVEDQFESMTFGSYEQDNDKANGEEEIEWLVLKEEENRALLVSKYVLDYQLYNASGKFTAWEDCSLRGWLNDEFYNTAFSESEKLRILTTELADTAEVENETDDGVSTGDKVFLLSSDEVEEYLDDFHSRECLPTDYAIARGVLTYDEDDTDGSAACWWLLRPSAEEEKIPVVMSFGVTTSLNYSVPVFCSAVRPALWILLDPDSSEADVTSSHVNAG